MKRVGGMAGIFVLFLGLVISAWAVPTKITIGVIARDAKFIGTSMGGVLVMINDVETGELLAKGYAQGSTGNTELLMATPKERYTRLIVGKTSRFVATLDLEEPRKVRIIARGPMVQSGNANEVSVTTWVVPGKDINELVLEMPGLVVRALNPSPHSFVEGPATVKVKASVTPMCGCPITPKSYWEPDNYEVGVIVKKDGRYFNTYPLKFTGETNIFETELTLDKGAYEFIIYAYDAKKGNTGVDKTTVIVR